MDSCTFTVSKEIDVQVFHILYFITCFVPLLQTKLRELCNSANWLWAYIFHLKLQVLLDHLLRYKVVL